MNNALPNVQVVNIPELLYDPEAEYPLLSMAGIIIVPVDNDQNCQLPEVATNIKTVSSNIQRGSVFEVFK